MTFGQLADMERQVAEGIRRLNEANVNDEDICIIMSRDVYEMAAQELLAFNVFDFRVAYRGHDVFLVEHTSNPMFTPAIKRYQTGLDFDSEQIGIGTFIICESGDDGSLCTYMKTQTHPAIFRETGLTVHQAHQTERVAFYDRLNMVNGNGRIYAPEFSGERMTVPAEPPRYTVAWGEPGWSAIEESICAGVDEMIRESIVSTVMGAETPTSSGVKKRVRQKKLTPEDTKELDEFLESFKILESAT